MVPRKAEVFVVLSMRFQRAVLFTCAVLACGALLLWPFAALASGGKPNERFYNAPFGEVWPVCVKTANEHWKVTHTDEANGILKFRQRTSFRTNTWGMIVSVTVVKADESHTTVTLTFEKFDPLELSWARRDIEKRFFAALDNSFVASPLKTGSSTTTGSGNQH